MSENTNYTSESGKPVNPAGNPNYGPNYAPPAYGNNYSACPPPYHGYEREQCYYPNHGDYGHYGYSGGGYDCAPGYGNRYGAGPYRDGRPWLGPNAFTHFINRPGVNNFLRGVGIAAIGLLLAPSIARIARPIIVKTVQGAVVATEEMKGFYSDAKEEAEDIFAEAKWENERTRDQRGEKPE